MSNNQPTAKQRTKRYPPPRQHKLPDGPDAQAANWTPPGTPARPAPRPIPAEAQHDSRQLVLDLEDGA